MEGKPLVITAAICGAEVTKDQNPNVPYSAAELAEEAARCYAEGARVIHLHVRKPDGSPTQDRETFRKAIEAIRARLPEVIIQTSTGGAVGMSVEERTQPLDLDPHSLHSHRQPLLWPVGGQSIQDSQGSRQVNLRYLGR